MSAKSFALYFCGYLSNAQHFAFSTGWTTSWHQYAVTTDVASDSIYYVVKTGPKNNQLEMLVI